MKIPKTPKNAKAIVALSRHLAKIFGLAPETVLAEDFDAAFRQIKQMLKENLSERDVDLQIPTLAVQTDISLMVFYEILLVALQEALSEV